MAELSDQEAQKARADRLRTQVKKILEKAAEVTSEETPADEAESRTPSPREFIHREMAKRRGSRSKNAKDK